MACHQEHKQRIDLTAQVKMLEGQQLSSRHAAHYNGLIYAGRFTDAIICGEALLAANPTGCPPLPSGASPVTPGAHPPAVSDPPTHGAGTTTPGKTKAEATWGTGPNNQAEAAWAGRRGKRPRSALTRAAGPTANPADQSWRDADHDAGIDEQEVLGLGYPINSYLLPVLTGTLRSHADLLFGFSKFSEEVFGPKANGKALITLGFDLRYATGDRVEIGLGVPLLTLGYYIPGTVTPYIDEAAFGCLEPRLKVKIWGSSTGPVVISAYVEGALPTVAFYDGPEVDSRSFGQVRFGVAAASQLFGRLAVGGGTGQNWTILGQGQHDVGTHQIDLWGVYFFHRVLAVQLALQFDIPHHYEGSGAETAFMLLPAVQFYPTPQLHIDLGARFAATEAALRHTAGRAALLFALGYLF
jgi:hypothetical protein